MNPALSDKDASIQTLIGYLVRKYGSDAIRIRDYWEADRCAIGLMDAAETYLVYISTNGLAESSYYVALENPTKPGDESPYVPAGEFSNLGLEEVEALMVKHLRIGR